LLGQAAKTDDFLGVGNKDFLLVAKSKVVLDTTT
jgi:hypothetical protein